MIFRFKVRVQTTYGTQVMNVYGADTAEAALKVSMKMSDVRSAWYIDQLVVAEDKERYVLWWACKNIEAERDEVQVHC